jgi:hypothetical protein
MADLITDRTNILCTITLLKTKTAHLNGAQGGKPLPMVRLHEACGKTAFWGVYDFDGVVIVVVMAHLRAESGVAEEAELVPSMSQTDDRCPI